MKREKKRVRKLASHSHGNPRVPGSRFEEHAEDQEEEESAALGPA